MVRPTEEPRWPIYTTQNFNAIFKPPELQILTSKLHGSTIEASNILKKHQKMAIVYKTFTTSLILLWIADKAWI